MINFFLKGLPPIRSLATTKKKKKVKAKEKDEVGKSKKKSVAPRDAKAWDKLDIVGLSLIA